jgi:hypothetical protein
VNCIAYDEISDFLYIGDERGNVIAYDFREIISSIELQDPTSKSNYSNSGSVRKNTNVGAMFIEEYPLKVLWRNKDHIESVRHLNFLQ